MTRSRKSDPEGRPAAENGHKPLTYQVTFDGRLYVNPDDLIRTPEVQEQLRVLREVTTATDRDEEAEAPG